MKKFDDSMVLSLDVSDHEDGAGAITIEPHPREDRPLVNPRWFNIKLDGRVVALLTIDLDETLLLTISREEKGT